VDWVPLEPTAPRWWSADGNAASVAAPVVSVPRPRVKPKSSGGEAGLFTPASAAWIDALFASETYANQRKIAGRATLADDLARRMIEVFVESDSAGTDSPKITEQALAARLASSVSDTRKRVTMLRNLLNVDGYEVLGQPDRDSLALDIKLLKTQFALVGGAA